MHLLVLKLLLAPLLLLGSYLVSERWGDRVGGCVLGLPLVSGPVSVLLFLEHGRSFAISAAHSALVGFVAGGVFCASYATLSARRPWHQALPASLAAFLVTAWVVEPLHLDWVRSALLVLGVLVLLARSVSQEDSAEAGVPPKRIVALQMIVAAGVVAGLTTMAGTLGSHLAGMLATVPAISALMATSSVRRAGQGAASEVLRGAVAGSWGGAAFFAVAGPLLAAANPLAAYGAGAAAALLGGMAGARFKG